MTLNLSRKKTAPPPTFKGHYAGFVSRLLAFVIDILIVTLSIGIMLGTVALILNFFNINLESLAVGDSDFNSFVRTVLLFLTGFGFTFTVSLVYTVFFWVAAGKTVGKAVMGLRVIGPKGSRVTFSRAMKRYIGYWISAIALFMGYFWVLVNDERRGWHDIIAGTSVIYDHEAQNTEAGLGRLARYAPRLEAKAEKKALVAGPEQTALPNGPQSGSQSGLQSGPQEENKE